MLRIRLQRTGRKHESSFRLVLTERQNSNNSGRVLEVLGNYDPRFNKPVIVADRVKHWIAMGAKPTDTVHNLLVSTKIVDGKKINVLPKKTPPKKEEAPAPAAAPVVAALVAVAPVAVAPVVEAPVEVPVAEVTTETPVAESEAPTPVEEVAAA